MAKMMSPNSTIWWVPIATAYDPDLPSAAVLTAARNISCAVVSGFTLNPTDSDTDTSTSICDNANIAIPTFYNYEASLTFFRDSVMLDIASDYGKSFAFFRNGKPLGWLVQRLGYASTVAAAVGQEVSSYKLQADLPQDVVTDANIQFTVPFLAQGKMSQYKALVA